MQEEKGLPKGGTNSAAERNTAAEEEKMEAARADLVLDLTRAYAEADSLEIEGMLVCEFCTSDTSDARIFFTICFHERYDVFSIAWLPVFCCV